MTNQIERRPRVSSLEKQLTAVSVIVALGLLTAAAIFAFGGANLSVSQRWLLLGFLVAFSILGFGFCAWLILRRQRKFSALDSDDEFSWQLMTPEQQRRKFNLEINLLANALPSASRDELSANYVVAEDLAMRNIELETDLPLVRHVVLEGVPFDGVAFKNNQIYCVEVLFLTVPNVSQERVDFMLEKVEYAAGRVRESSPNIKTRIFLALVTQFAPESDGALNSALRNLFSVPPVDVEVVIYKFRDLQNKFTAE